MGRAGGTGLKLAVGLLVVASAPVAAKDHGQHGAVFPLSEQDFLKVLEHRLRALEKTGALAAANRKMAEKVKAQVLEPAPVEGIAPAQQARSWLFDPSIELGEDVRDEAGRVLAPRGSRVNPLDHVDLRQRLVFLNGQDEAQVRWALASTRPEAVKLILVQGSAFRLMERHKRRFYFDQSGVLTRRFGIAAVPAVVEQEGRVLRIREVPVPAPTSGRAP